MTNLKGRIDFTLFFTVDYANPNGDPLNGNRPRTTMDGYGEITDVCIKRKIRNRWMEMGEKVFVQPESEAIDGCKNLHDRFDSCKKLKAEIDKKKKADVDLCKKLACENWIDVRSFGHVFPFKVVDISFGVRGPVSIRYARSLSPIDVVSSQITKSTNTEPGEGREASTMGMKHQVRYAVYKVMGSIHPQLADKTGFSQEDAEKLKEALLTLFDGDSSAARPDGSMEVRKMYWWQQESRTPSITSAKIQRGFQVKSLEQPNCFEDYEISWNVEDCVDPEIYEA